VLWEVYKKGESAPKKCVEYYRYGFQGEFAEEDSETGWNSFELRMYDPVISRWLVPDPYKQFWSPYMSMANDPVNRVDPDGGCVDDLPCEGRSTNADGSDAGGFNVNGAFLPDEALAFNGPVETIDLGAALDFISNAATVGGVFTAAAAANLASGAKASSSAPYLFVTPGRRILETTIPGLARSWSKIYPAFPNQSNVIRGSFAGAANGIGYVFTGLGIGISTYQYSTGQISTSTYAADLIFSRVGLAGPAGAGVSATYFLMVRPNNVAPPSQLYNDPSIVQQDATRQISINPNLRR
ncbi:MAG: RHS repeat-associated core domain-containing protein, partial [Bacteroidota bacterium]